MKQKFQLIKDLKKKRLVIKEYAELDKDAFALLCEETYDMDQVQAAAKRGREVLVDTLRTQNLYPIGMYAGKIAETAAALLDSDEKATEEILFDDMDLIYQDQKKEWGLGEEAIQEEAAELDELLEEEVDDGYDKAVFEGYRSSVQLADEDSLETEEDP